MNAYYNEFDPRAAAWLRELIKQGHIAEGEVDERSIADVRPVEIAKFAQCHFFAGIGVWSYALRKAGWPDNRPIWTGSCPCQPFSAAGKGNGFDDERHLWPHFHWLISQRRPSVVLGEQVASKDGLAWLDLVQDDLEGAGYAVGAADLCAAGVGAPHIRQRLWWVGKRKGGVGDAYGARAEAWLPKQMERQSRFADVVDNRSCRLSGPDQGEPKHEWLEHSEGDRRIERWAEPIGRGAPSRCGDGRLADADQDGCKPGIGIRPIRAEHDAEHGIDASRMADTIIAERPGRQPGQRDSNAETGRNEDTAAASGLRSDIRSSPTNGFWRDADWLFCRDGKWRPVEPGSQPLAHGAAARVGRLRGYGNAIVAQVAQTFIESVMEGEVA